MSVHGSVNASRRTLFSSLHARVLCHATEVRERVERALLNVVGETELAAARTYGHHGNEILVIEARLKGQRADRILERLSPDDLREILDNAESRIDDSCNLFIRIDKQKAYEGEIALASDDDAIAIRMKVAAFPARKSIAVRAVADFLDAKGY